MEYREIVNSYKAERQSLLDANWKLSQENAELKHRIEEAEKQITESLEELENAKDCVVNLYKQNLQLQNRVETLLATLPKER